MPTAESERKKTGTNSRQVSCWSRTENKVALVILAALAIATRFYQISRPNSAVFDEVHFVGFTQRYLNREYFFDVHPPLGKLIFAGISWLWGDDGKCPVAKIGDSYQQCQFPATLQRLFSASCGIAVVLLIFAMLVEAGYSLAAATTGAALVLFDGSLITLSRFVLLDGQLFAAIFAACFFWLRFQRERSQPFSWNWWKWLCLTGTMLGVATSIKLIGLFVVSLVGLLTVVDLWQLADVKSTPSRLQLLAHFLARCFGLIFIPIAIFVGSYAVHFAVSSNSGPGDNLMSVAFQASLNGNPLGSETFPIYYGSLIHIRSNVEQTFLHSCSASYPQTHLDGKISSAQQIVSGVGVLNDFTQWEILPASDTPFDAAENPRIPVNGDDLIRLRHAKTGKFLLTHDVASPLTVTNQEVAAVDLNDPKKENFKEFTIWRLKVISGHTPLMCKFSKFRLVHQKTGCTLFNFRQNLPKWGKGQREVNAVRNEMPQTLWFIDETQAATPWTRPELERVQKSVQEARLGFWKKFTELLLRSIELNSGLRDHNPYLIPPYQWPILKRGLAFWVNEDKSKNIYLLGNPVAWAISLVSIFILPAILGLHVFLDRRGAPLLASEQLKTIVERGGLQHLIGYVAHFLPFFAMGRCLYFHHYLPSFAFTSMIVATIFQLMIDRYPGGKWKWIVMSGTVTAIFASFLKYSCLTYGLETNAEYLKSIALRKEWHFVQ